MSCYIDFDQHHDLADWLAPGHDLDQTPRCPNPTAEDGICRRCWRRRGLAGFSSVPICAQCRCYVSDVSRLDGSTYCQCQCMCEHSMELSTDDLDSDVESTESGSSEGEFESGSEFEVSSEEARGLRRGISAWELHDLERLGYPWYRLIEQFPEVEVLHGRGQIPKEKRARPFQTCRVCEKEREYLVEQALAASHVDICNNCQKPVIRHVASFRSPVEPSQCFCHCSCPVELPASDESPIFLPFIMNLAGATPSPNMVHYLQKHGFCHRNEHAEAVRAAMQTGYDIPSYDEILSNTIPWFIAQTSEQYLACRLGALAVARSFPNGSPRVDETDSGLPKALEDYIIQHVDGNAFGHETRQKWEVDGPDLSQLSYMSVEEAKKWIYVDMLLQEVALQKQLRMRQQACTRFALWTVEYAEDFGIGDEDGDSLCSESLFPDRRSWREWSRAQCWCSSGGEDNCCAREHEKRHVERRLQRLAHRGSYPVRQEMIEWAAQRWLTQRDMMFEAESKRGGLDLHSLQFWRESRNEESARYADTETESDEEEREEDDNDDEEEGEGEGEGEGEEDHAHADGNDDGQGGGSENREIRPLLTVRVRWQRSTEGQRIRGPDGEQSTMMIDMDGFTNMIWQTVTHFESMTTEADDSEEEEDDDPSWP